VEEVIGAFEDVIIISPAIVIAGAGYFILD
jgi:hypothetical protein